MKIKLTNVYVDEQAKALRFYTEVLGFAKNADFTNGRFRWLTVVSPEEAAGTELQLALNNNPAAKAYQQAIFQQSRPAAMFYTDDVKADYERLKARGAEFTMPPRRDGLDHCNAKRDLWQPHSAHPTGTLLRTPRALQVVGCRQRGGNDERTNHLRASRGRCCASPSR